MPDQPDADWIATVVSAENVSTSADSLIEMLREVGADIDFLNRDDLGPHYVHWIERTERDGGPAGIFFYVDEVNHRVVVEKIGAP